jgi:predicted transcriptional regulator
MKYTSIEEKDQIKKEVKKLLVSKEMTIRTFCKTKGFPMSKAYQMLGRDNRYHIDHDEITKMISKIDSDYTLVRIGNDMRIIKSKRS